MDAKTIIEIVKSGGTLENANMLELQLEGVTKGVTSFFLYLSAKMALVTPVTPVTPAAPLLPTTPRFLP